MRAKLESITQTLAQEMETTGTIVLNGQTFRKNSLNQSPYAGLCRPAVQKLASLVKDSIPESRVDGVSFITANDDALKRSKHVIAIVKTKEDVVYLVDPTIKQYIPNAKMVYSTDEQYPIGYYSSSMRGATIYNGL